MDTVKPVAYDRHHRKSRSKKGKSNPRNISIVPRYMHVAFHQMFGTMEPDEIAKQLTKILDSLSDTWINPDYMLVAVRREQ